MADPTHWTTIRDAVRLAQRFNNAPTNTTLRWSYKVLANRLSDRACLEVYDAKGRHQGYVEQRDIDQLENQS